MEHQCLITNGSGEVTKKRMLSRLGKLLLSHKYTYITTAEGFTYPLIKKSNKICEHDDDHSYPNNNIVIVERANGDCLSEKFGDVQACESLKNTIDNCVTDNCLAEIFMYLPACERPKLALVCKKWKKILNKAWHVKKLELIYWRYDEYPNCLAKFSTSDGGYSFLKSLLNKCGHYLTKLDLTAYGNCNIVPVINYYCPNLVTLRLRFTNMDQVILANSFTRLSKLKSLTIIFQNIKSFVLLPTVALINSLRNVADTLTELSLLNWTDEIKTTVPDFTKFINDVVRDLKALKILEVAGIGISINVTHYLACNKISYYNHTVDLKQYLPTLLPFINIKELQIVGCRIRDNTLYSIANTFKNLEFLHIYSSWVTDDGVLALSKMNNLRRLYFVGDTKITDSSIKLLKNLIKLGLPSSNKITDDSVITVLENSPQMSVLDIYGANVTAKLVKKAAEISRIRKQRLILCVALMPDIQKYNSPYFELHIYEKRINGIPTPVPVGVRAHVEGTPDAKNKIIDRLNDDCLAEIFMYLPAYERPKLALVCKKWKKALDDSWFKVLKLELNYWQYDQYSSFLYKNYPTTYGQFSFIKTLLNKCGGYLTKLNLSAFGDSRIVPIINRNCPNLVTLCLRFSCINDEILHDAFSRLSKLEKLTIIFYTFVEEYIPVDLINSLRNVADTLTDLSLLNWMYDYHPMNNNMLPEEFTYVIPELKALKKLEVIGMQIPPAVSVYVEDNKIFITDYTIFYHQRNKVHTIKNLDLSHYRVTDNSLYTIANVMMSLEVLYIFCEWVTDDGVVAISKMNKLHTLEFIGRNNVTDSSIKLLEYFKKLKLPISNKITDVSVTKVLENSPDMEELYVEDTGVTVEFIKKAADVSKNREQLLRLFYSSVTSTPDIEQYKSQYFDIHIIQQEQKQKIPSVNANNPFIENVRVHFL